MNRPWKTAATAAFAIILGSFALLQGCGGGGGGGGSAPPAAVPQSQSGSGKLSAVVRLTNRSAGRTAGQEIPSTVNVTLTVSGIYAGDDSEFPPVSTTAVVDLSRGSASVSVLNVPVGVNHLLTITAEWGDGFTETIMALIPLISEGELVTVTADEESTALARAAIHFAEHENKRLADLKEDEILDLEEAIAFLHGSGIPYDEIQPSQVEAYFQNLGVPASVSLNAPTGPIVAGNTFQFTGEVLDGNGTAIPDLAVTLTLSNPDLGTIDSNGLFTATTEGEAVVTATYQTFTATADVIVITVCASDMDCDDGMALTLDTCASAGTANATCEHAAFACGTNADCDDANALTHDECMNGGTLSASCANHPIACSADADCDDANSLTYDTCANGGTMSASCMNESFACNTSMDCGAPTPVCLSGGGPGSSCIACAQDADCDDINGGTIDTCSNPNTVNASCMNTPVACNTDMDCDDANPENIDTCYNPGMANAVCGHSTWVSNNIDADATWSLAGSPYIVAQQIAVGASATLTIDPGVEVWFRAPADVYNDLTGYGYGNIAGIRVDGALYAAGTSASHILMTIDQTNPSPISGGWGGIYFAYGSMGGNLQYIDMEYPSYAIQMDSVVVDVDNVNITMAGSPGVYSYHIYTKTERGWTEKAVEHYGMRYQTRGIDLSGLLPDADGEYKVRIVQSGMHAAHVDSVELALDGGTYRVAEATDPAGSRDAAYKLTFKDNDVFDAHEKTFDVRFDTSSVNFTPRRATLLFNAREEDKSAIEYGKAFTYPRNGFYEDVNSAEYYSYKLSGAPGALRMDGEKTSADALPAPLFMERTVPMSGHPVGNTYGYVKNDGRYLYAALDFTPDNTYDGDADFASVYVRAGNELKRFRVSVPEQRYGKVGYTYTDTVGYQHKYYEFKIPLSEIGNPRPGGTLALMFDAYGTASLFTAVVNIYYVPNPVNISNLNIEIDPMNAGYINGMYIAYAQVNAQNITISNASTGLDLYSANNSMFSNVTVTDSDYENLYIYNSSGVMITGSTFNMSHNYTGATIYYSDGVQISNSDFSYNPNGLDIEYASVDITGSRFHNNCGSGLYAYGDMYATNTINISNSNFTDNAYEAIYGDYYAYIYLDSVYMANNNGAMEVEASTNLPDSDSQVQQYFGLSGLINPALTPNAVMPNAAGTQYCSY